MHKKPAKRDDAQNARRIVEAAIGEPLTDHQKKDPHFKALGRLGGLVGGKARAKSLTSEKRRAIAKKAAAARWSKHS
jgi:hypothetical protein